MLTALQDFIEVDSEASADPPQRKEFPNCSPKPLSLFPIIPRNPSFPFHG
jgi:hypothetical protein